MLITMTACQDDSVLNMNEWLTISVPGWLRLDTGRIVWMDLRLRINARSETLKVRKQHY